MSVSFENKETNHGVLTFTISQEQIKPALDRVFESVKKTLNVPGFRKGHIPRPIFNQRFGEEALYQDAFERSSSSSMKQLLKKLNRSCSTNQLSMLYLWKKKVRLDIDSSCCNKT